MMMGILILSMFSCMATAGVQGLLKEGAENLYRTEFEKLDRFENFSGSQLKGKKTLWVLFQPECKSCERQFKSLSCLSEKVEKVALGFWGDKQELQKVLRLGRYTGMALQATPTVQKKLKLKQTPTLLITNGDGNIIYRAESFQACDSLQKIINAK